MFRLLDSCSCFNNSAFFSTSFLTSFFGTFFVHHEPNKQCYETRFQNKIDKKKVNTSLGLCMESFEVIGEEIRTKKPPGWCEWVCVERFNVRSCQNQHWLKYQWSEERVSASLRYRELSKSISRWGWCPGGVRWNLSHFSCSAASFAYSCSPVWQTLEQMVSFSSIARSSFRKVDVCLAESSRIQAGTWKQNHWERSLFSRLGKTFI